jgi:hypothetical protein
VRDEVDAVLAALDEHRALWARTLTETPAGHSEDACTGYRMALDWVADLLEPLRGDPTAGP